MVKKTYSVTIDEDVVDTAQKINNTSGRKLSPVIELLLVEWIKKHEEGIE